MCRHSIDERLTIEDTTGMQGPLEPVARKLVGIGKNRVSRTSDRTMQSPTATPPNHRSIFSSYWKTEPRPSRPRPSHPLHSPSRISSKIEKRQRPQRRQIHKTYTYNFDRDPYQFFGIEDDESKTSTPYYDGDINCLNSYESVLHNSEVGVIEKDCRRSRTCPSLYHAKGGMDGMVLNRAEKTAQSDTILYTKTRKSCLQKGRFSFDADNSDGTQPTKGGSMRKNRTSVSFESEIKVHLFQSPVEKWAENGWSNWFGHSY